MDYEERCSCCAYLVSTVDDVWHCDSYDVDCIDVVHCREFEEE